VNLSSFLFPAQAPSPKPHAPMPPCPVAHVPHSRHPSPVIPLRDDNPSSIKSVVTISFIVACVFVFLWQLSLGPVRGQQAIFALGRSEERRVGKECRARGRA